MSDNAFDIDDILNEISKRREMRGEETRGAEPKADSQESVEKPIEKPVEKPIEKPIEISSEKTDEKFDEKTIKRAEPAAPKPEYRFADRDNNGGLTEKKPMETEPMRRPAEKHTPPRPERREAQPMAAWERAYLDSVKGRHISDNGEEENARKDEEKGGSHNGYSFDDSQSAEEKQNGALAFDDMMTAGSEKEEPEAKYDGRERRRKKEGKKKKKSKKSKILLSVIIVLVVAIIGTGTALALHFNNLLDNITDNSDKNSEGSKIEEWTGMDNLVVKFDDINESGYVDSYLDMIKQWYYNGDPVSSTNIYNVLLIGEDTRGEAIELDGGTRADSAIIASVNTETGELVLSSILRDSYSYYEVTPGDESTGKFGKICEAMMYGGLNCYINAVERMLKVNIDNYVVVNFESFKHIIDALDGIDIEMSESEIREINNHPTRYGDVYIDGDAGLKHLDGTQALAYCRIRYIDSDVNRSERQRTTLLYIFDQLKTASTLQLTNVVSGLLPYVKTGFSKQEILSIGQYALSHGWLKYKMVTHTVPKNETRPDGTVVTTCVGGSGKEFYNVWCWKLDFPLSTQILQEKIYGKTSVILAENRPNFKKLSSY